MLWLEQRYLPLAHTSTHRHTITPLKIIARSKGEQLEGFKPPNGIIIFAFGKYFDNYVKGRLKGQNITSEETMLIV